MKLKQMNLLLVFKMLGKLIKLPIGLFNPHFQDRLSINGIELSEYI
jgi:hypothetical protein